MRHTEGHTKGNTKGHTEGHTGPPFGIKSMDEVKRTAKVVRSSIGVQHNCNNTPTQTQVRYMTTTTYVLAVFS